MVSLKDGQAPTADYIRTLRQVLPARSADLFYFQPADMANADPEFRPHRADRCAHRRL